MLDGLKGEESGNETVGQRQREKIAIHVYLAIL